MDTTGSINNEDYNIESIEQEDDGDYSEERELVNDSCSTKVLDPSEEPRDRYCLVYILFYLFGITSLVSWNFIITANDVSIFFIYFMYIICQYYIQQVYIGDFYKILCYITLI